MNNLKMYQKIMLSFLLTIVFTTTVGSLAVSYLNELRGTTNQMYEVSFKINTTVLNVKADILNMQSQINSLIAKNDTSSINAVETKINNLQAEVLLGFKILEQMDTQKTEVTNQFKQAFTEWQSVKDQVIEFVRGGEVDKAKKLQENEGQRKMDQIISYSNQLDILAMDEARNFNDVANNRGIATRNNILGLVIANAIIAVLITIYLTNNINEPLLAVTSYATKFAEGVLNQTYLDEHRGDELGTLMKAFNNMNRTFSNMITEVKDGVVIISEASSEIMASVSQVSIGAVETASALSETSTTVEQVKQSAQYATERSKVVSESASKTVMVSEDGIKAVDNTIKKMRIISERVESMTDSLIQLSEKSQNIGEIIETVNELAEQSNLLAVNASIEAAKAGEHGKGFAVVAKEVKQLADQSKDATLQVRKILNDITKATNTAVLASEQSTRTVESGVKQSQDASDAIESMIRQMDKVAQSAMQIEATNTQQLTGMDQISIAIDNIKRASEQNMDGTKQVKESVQNLHQLGSRLKEGLEKYQVVNE